MGVHLVCVFGSEERREDIVVHDDVGRGLAEDAVIERRLAP